MPKSAAISGMTPHEHSGDRPPISAASTIIVGTRPLKARAISLSAPLASAAAVKVTEANRNGATQTRLASVKARLACACCQSPSAVSSPIRAMASHTRSTAGNRQDRAARLRDRTFISLVPLDRRVCQPQSGGRVVGHIG